jgi:YVTN family beta-propeller protein
MKRLINLMLVCSFLLAGHLASAQSNYHLVNTFHIQSAGGWDYIAADPGSNRLYVSHGTQVNILDKIKGDSLGVIPNTTGVHGIAFVHSLGKGYTSNGRINNVTVFDLKTANIITQIATGQNPDAIFYDDYSKKVITCNGRSSDLSIIDPVTDKVIATIPVGGKPETAVGDGAGKVYVNIEDKNEIVEVDINNAKVENHWPLAPAEGPTGLSIDRVTKRLFSGCDKLLVVMDATNGKIVSQIPIGDGCDGTDFDPGLKYAFASCGAGVLSVIQEVSQDEFKLLENVPTKVRARTISVDASTHLVYLPTAEFGPVAKQGERPPMVPGTFQILVFGRN